MERKRKGYLLRKSVSFDRKEPQPQCICNNALSSSTSSRTYDLQTQTVTFGAEDEGSSSTKQHKRFSASSILKKFSSSSAGEEESAANHKTKKQQKPFSMDSPDLEEFYPESDHPSPSTFTAWDAFLSGTQAFFPSASSYMDVIPEVEEEDEEALLETDTDDTGSSVSTVVDRFSSRNSTANSSFSERWKGVEGPGFDLERVLSPFEKLEKELDAHQGSRDEDGRKKEIQRGPIVVITNSSSCEDVHSEDDDTITNRQHISINHGSNSVDNSTSKMNGSTTISTENIPQKNIDSASTKPVSKSKMVNGCKTEKSPAKKAKSDTAIPIPPPPSNPKKKRSYPTPNIPPRMSLHAQARRTRSDPGTPDQPSRIPRPISSRSPVSVKKTTPKTNKSSKVNPSKKQSNSDNPKLVKNTQEPQSIEVSEVKEDNSGMEIEDHQVKEFIEVKPQEFGLSQEPVETMNERDIDRELDESLPHPDSFEIDPNWNTIPDEKNSFENDPIWDSIPDGNGSFDDDDCWKSPPSNKDSNPFRSPNKTNPFTSDGEEVEVAKGSNPFESEAIPALQPKGQMTAAILAPPIPERPSLLKREKPVEVLNNTEKIISNVLSPVSDNQELPEDIPLLPSSMPPTKGLFNEPHLEKTEEEDQVDVVSNSEPATKEPESTVEVNSFWPKVSTSQEVEVNDKFSVEKAEVDALFDNIEIESAQQRPIEDILQALDQLVSAPREVEISIDWGEGVSIRETPVFCAASGDGSRGDEETEAGAMAEDRRRCIESLLQEVDECLRTKVEEDPAIAESGPIAERTPLGPGTPDVPSAGYTAPSSPKNHDEDIDVLSNNSSPEMLRHQKHDGQRSAFQTSVYTQDPKNHSPGCDDSGVFLEEPLVSSPETQTRSAISRLHNITQFQKEDSSDMRQYSIPAEGLDSDDLGLASSSIDSADDLDGDPLPSTLQICPPPTVPNRQKPPPVPTRKSPPQKHNSRFSIEFDQRKPPLSKSSSSGDDSNFGEGDLYTNEDQLTDLLCHDENSKNILNHQKNEQSRFAMTRSFHEDTLLGLQRDSQESKTAFLSRTLSSSKKLEVPDSLSKISDNSSAFKWKSEECLRTAAESKWSLTGRRFEKSVSVKDRIAMFSEMEANQTPLKKDLQRYGSENNIKTVTLAVENKKMDLPPTEEHKQQSCLSRDTKWQSLHNISKKSPEKEVLYPSSNMKSALSIPSLAPDSLLENPTGNGYAPFPIKLDVEPPKPIVSTYPETQLTNNKRYNYGLYSLKNLKNTEDLLSKKAAGSNLLSIIDSRKQPLRKLKGLVIPEKPQQQDGSQTLPTIVSSDSDGGAGTRDNRRASLPITVVTAAVSKSTSLPRNNHEYQKQTSLLTEPPWKSERTTSSNNTLPKYSPAFKKRSLELPGSSLSPTPPSSLTSPLSPPPSSPSSICSSNASSTLQQNVFQFSLSHSKPVQPLLPEKALMSPTPSLQPSDVEYEGDNSEDSSHSAASPMRNAVRAPKENKMAPPPLNSGIMHYEKSNTFTSSAKPIVLQPLLVETLVKSTSSSRSEPRAAVCISKTEINLRGQNSTPVLQKKTADTSSIQAYLRSKKETKLSSNGKDYRSDDPLVNECITSLHLTSTENRNGSYPVPPDFLDGHPPFTNGNLSKQNGQNSRSAYSNGNTLDHDVIQQPKSVFSNGKKSEEVPVGKFRACPLNLQDRKSNKGNRRQLHSDESEDEDDDSHSTLSHRTEDSRHTTTDDCLSDATTDSFEKPRVANEVPSNMRSTTNEDYASTEGYLSDASTDVSLRRFTHRHLDASTEEYLSDATAESPDPDWVSNRDTQDFRNRGYITRNNEPQQPLPTTKPDGTVDLRPKRLSQQRTVLKASIEPSGSVQKFKALAEKWEQRADVVISPPPPPLLPAPLLPKKEQPRTANAPLASALFSSTGTATKGRGSSLPPSLMPRSSSEKKQQPLPLLKSPPAERQQAETNGWSAHYETANARRDSSSSNSSKTTLKEEDTTTSILQDTLNSDLATPVLNTRTPSLRSDTWNNEPRNRRGADFSRSDYQPPTTTRSSYANSTKSNFSDIRRNFENGNKEEDKTSLRKKTPPILPDRTPAATPIALPRRASSFKKDEESDEETRRLLEGARLQLQTEGGIGGVQLLSVLLRREGADGGSVGITLAGGADYEVKEITVHKVISGSIADRDGRVMKGDRVMSINGRDVRGVSHGEALHILKAPNPKVLLVLARIADTTLGQHRVDSGKAEGKRQPALNHQDAETFLVELQKDATGVGFSIEGGKDSPQGDRPLLIKRLFKGGAADKEGRLEEGDEIISINNHPVFNMTRTEAWNFLKKLPEGGVQLYIKKSKATALIVS